MRPFTPTLGISDTGKNARSYVKDHMDVFWEIFKPLAVYIAILTAMDAVINFIILDPSIENQLNIGALISSYFIVCLVISWHRVVIHGPDRYTPMDPFKPKKNELVFIGMGLVIGLLPVLSGLLGIAAGAIINSTLAATFAVLLVLAGMYVAIKACFYFPAKATDNSITIKQSLAMTKGYIWKLMSASFMASLRLIGLLLLYAIGGGIVIGVIAGFFHTEGGALLPIAAIIYELPMTFYFNPLLTVLGVTVLSNYYQHSLQNKVSHDTAALSDPG